jgi:DNA-binding response OmpR family regulator
MKKILLIDDSVTIHRVIDLCLDKERFDTEKTFTADDAVMKLKNGTADIILLDNKLDGIVLADFTRKLRSLAPAAWIMLLIGAFDQFTDANLAKTGADDYLFKPFDSSALDAKINFGLNRTSSRPSAEAISVPKPAPVFEPLSAPEPEIEIEQEPEIVSAPVEVAEAAEIINPPEKPEEESISIDAEKNIGFEEEFSVPEPEPEEKPVPEEESEPEPEETETDFNNLQVPEDEDEKDRIYKVLPDDLSMDSHENELVEPAEAISAEEKMDLDNFLDDLDEIKINDDNEELEREDSSQPENLFADTEPEVEKAHEEQKEKEIFIDLDELSLSEDEDDGRNPSIELTQKTDDEVTEYVIPEEDIAEAGGVAFAELPEDDVDDLFAGLQSIDEDTFIEEESFNEPEIEEESDDDYDDLFAGLESLDSETADAGEPSALEETEEEADENVDDLFAGLQSMDEDIFIEEETAGKKPLQKEEPIVAEALTKEYHGKEADAEELIPQEPVMESFKPEDYDSDDIFSGLENFDEGSLAEDAMLTDDKPLPENETEAQAEDQPEKNLPAEMAFEGEIYENEPSSDLSMATLEHLPIDSSFENVEDEADAETPEPEVSETIKEEPVKAAPKLSREDIKDAVYRSIDGGMIKAAIQEVLSEKMEEVLREVLPEIAEMVIREEIERLKRGE